MAGLSAAKKQKARAAGQAKIEAEVVKGAGGACFVHMPTDRDEPRCKSIQDLNDQGDRGDDSVPDAQSEKRDGASPRGLSRLRAARGAGGKG